ncbi:TetR family transcriptional regulator [Shimia litoralis]|uniref:TetR family transcriptional regulator n=1 Tax=Shimia litoralis TaxID=420403 RepID=A0A4U7N2L0_9RHOB|nr:TetR family transcriptional regulator C-terminal domain-containing protein [Shimia litoralis]TKZ19416.1 TetR family transcriptional regulator [Shimia litoralis]
MTNAKVGKPAASQKSRTASKEVRRQQLIDATIESIAKHGVSGTTMTTVTGFAGLSMGLVNFHFKNKETLFEETLRFLAEEHRDQWKKSYARADLTPQAKLLAIVDAHYHARINNRKKIAVWFAFYGEAASRARYRAIMEEIDPERWDISVDLIRKIISDGAYHSVEAECIADTLEGLYDGFWLNILMYPAKFSRQTAKSRIRAYLAATFPRHFETSHPEAEKEAK